jgi:uncharacterized glyoxalase superfamily protein PhnB
MSITLNPYLGFRDTAKQAMEFYQSVFGASQYHHRPVLGQSAVTGWGQAVC